MWLPGGTPGGGEVGQNERVRRVWFSAAVALGVAAAAETLTRYAPTASSVQFVLVVLIAGLAGTLPLAARRPTAAAIVLVVAGLVTPGPLVSAAVAPVLGGYRVGRDGAVPVAVLLGLPYLVFAFTGSSRVVLAGLIPAAALTGVARRMTAVTAAVDATRQDLATTRIESTTRGERTRIARELHDVVAHHVSMIAVQAETARLTTPGLPAAGAKRFAAIGDTARAALTEMRGLLGVLRSGDGPVERHPQPGLRELTALLDEVRDASGAGARLILRGTPAPLDPGVELAAYRIVQEALTNARRHAPGAAVDVELHYDGPRLQVSVRDNGPGAGDDGRGLGLLGMTERAAAAGGELRAGPATGGGFLVRATFGVRDPAVAP
jgi:signal transduction histidine kinase